MISQNIKWFLGLSVAVHAAALVALAQPEDLIGASGRTLLLSVSDRSSSAVSRPQSPADKQEKRAIDVPPLQPQAAQPVLAESAPAKHRSVNQAVAQLQAATPVKSSPDKPQASQAAASTTISREEQHRHLRLCVMELVTQQLNYPPIARRKGWQGVVKLELLIESDGRISDLHIEETSGYSLLDKAALYSLQLAHVPDAAQWLDGEAVSIIVPVEYRLIDG